MKQIAICGASDMIRSLLGEIKNCHQIYMEDEHFERGEVKLARSFESGEIQPDVVLVGYPGAAGLAACDFWYRRNNAPPILWFCDRMEFEPEAKRINVDFVHIGIAEQEMKKIVKKYLNQKIDKSMD